MNTPGSGSEISEAKMQEHVVVDGLNYKIVMFAPSRGFKLSAQIMKMIGGPMAQLATSKGDESKAIEVLPLAVNAMLKNMDVDEVMELIKALMMSVEYERKIINFDVHFHGRLGHMVKVLGKVIELQFEDLFTAIVDLLGGVLGG